MKKYLTLLLLFISCFSGSLSAQTAPWARLGSGARGIGAGNAGASSPEDGMYALYNPALIATNVASRVELTSGALPFGMRWNQAFATLHLPPKAAVQFGLIQTGVQDIDLRSPSGYQDGTVSTNEMMFFGSFGVALSNSVQGGVSFKFYRSRLHPDVDPATATSIDAGLLARISPRISAGVTVRDLIGAYRWNTQSFYGDETAAARSFNLPRSIVLSLTGSITPLTSVSAEFQTVSWNSNRFEPNELASLSSALFIETTGETRVNTSRFGLRHTFNERFTLRTGIEMQPETPEEIRFSAGFSLNLPYDRYRPAIDYALVRPPHGIGVMHLFTLRFSWNNPE
jgi:hypothetical protein